MLLQEEYLISIATKSDEGFIDSYLLERGISVIPEYNMQHHD